MDRALVEVGTDEFIEWPRYGARMIVARYSEFEKREGEIDPGDIGPIAWRQSASLRKSLILCPPSQPVDQPPLLFFDVDGFSRWDWSPTIDYEYVCPKRAIAAVYEERWDSQFAGYVVVLYDWALTERPKPSLIGASCK